MTFALARRRQYLRLSSSGAAIQAKQPEKRPFSRRALRIAGACVLLGAVVVSVFAAPGFVSKQIESDSLTPIGYAWEAMHMPVGWMHHQMSRTPSLIPDMALVGLLFLAGIPVSLTYAIYAFCQLCGLCYAGGWLASYRSKAPVTASAAAISVLLAALICAASMAQFRTGLYVLMPVYHAGAFILALAGMAAAARLTEASSSAHLVLLAASAAAVFLCDKMLFASFVVPTAASVCLAAAARRAGWQVVARVLLTLGFGLLFGWLMLAGLEWVGFHVGPQPSVFDAIADGSVSRFFEGLPPLLRNGRWFFGLGLAMLAISAGFGLRGARRGRTVEIGPAAAFVRSSGVLSMALILVFAICLHKDGRSYRYLAVLSVWPSILLTSLLPTWLSQRAPKAALCLGALGFLALILTHARIPGFDTPASACIRQWHDRLGLQAGLAEYWAARATEVALGYTTQIDLVFPDGRPRVWVSNPFRFGEDIHDPRHAPVYNFIIADGMDLPAVTARYGAPSRRVTCAESGLWIYDKPAMLTTRLREEAPYEY